MPPTVGKNGKERRHGDKKLESGLICKVRFCNTLPDIPFDPKFLVHPFDSNRFIQYIPTSLERNYKHELLTEHDLGVNIDLVDPDTYKTDVLAKLDPEDEKLLEEDSAPAPSDAKRSRHHNKNVSWLRKTEYISTEFTRWMPGNIEKAESRIGFNIKKHFKEEDLYRNRSSQIEAIEATFKAFQRPVEKHHSKPGVYAVEVLPLLPDFKLWRHPCAQVIFDANPSVKPARFGAGAASTAAPATPADEGAAAAASQDDSIPSAYADQMASQAMIRGMVDETGDQFVAYFLPTPDTEKKRRQDFEEGRDFLEDETYEYDLTREYNWNVKNKTMKGYEENYFLVFRDGAVFYNELETRVRLSKRRKPGQPGGAPTTHTKLAVRHRDFNEPEMKQQASRLAQLESDDDDDDEEEEEEEEEEEPPLGGLIDGAPDVEEDAAAVEPVVSEEDET